MIGIVYSIVAGIFIAMQGVLNTRVSEKIGVWYTVAIVHAFGLAVAVIVCLITKDGCLAKISEVNKFYLLGGGFGAIIVYSVMKGIISIGPSFSISIILIIQLLMTLAIDSFAWFGCTKIPFDYTKPLGIMVMVVGIIIFKIR